MGPPRCRETPASRTAVRLKPQHKSQSFPTHTHKIDLRVLHKYDYYMYMGFVVVVN